MRYAGLILGKLTSFLLFALYRSPNRAGLSLRSEKVKLFLRNDRTSRELSDSEDT